jgi:hypothetical protein
MRGADPDLLSSNFQAFITSIASDTGQQPTIFEMLSLGDWGIRVLAVTQCESSQFPHCTSLLSRWIAVISRLGHERDFIDSMASPLLDTLLKIPTCTLRRWIAERMPELNIDCWTVNGQRYDPIPCLTVARDILKASQTGAKVLYADYAEDVKNLKKYLSRLPGIVPPAPEVSPLEPSRTCHTCNLRPLINVFFPGMDTIAPRLEHYGLMDYDTALTASTLDTIISRLLEGHTVAATRDLALQSMVERRFPRRVIALAIEMWPGRLPVQLLPDLVARPRDYCPGLEGYMLATAMRRYAIAAQPQGSETVIEIASALAEYPLPPQIAEMME